jgi:hypothetical protein
VSLQGGLDDLDRLIVSFLSKSIQDIVFQQECQEETVKTNTMSSNKILGYL